MKIAILTQPLRYNYGGLLQNYALQIVLKEMGHNPVTLDPSPFAHTDWKTPFRIFKRTIQKYLFHQQKVDILREYKKNHDVKLLETNTGKFIKKHIDFIRYKKITDINPREYDAFIVGSDQVWRPKYNKGRLSNMFLDFTKEMKVRRIAYAASFGTDEWEFNEEQTTEFSYYISGFDGISVREDSGVTLCKNHFGVNATHVLDPTMLLKKDDYIKNILSSQENNKEKNLFYYILDSDDTKKRIIKDFEQKLHLHATTVRAKNDKSKNIKQRIQPPIENWLAAINNAEFVVTDSFHGCVFSIIFNKPFIVILNENRGCARINSLLRFFHLEDRLYDPLNDQSDTMIDWNSVNSILNEKRNVALSFLRSNLN